MRNAECERRNYGSLRSDFITHIQFEMLFCVFVIAFNNFINSLQSA